MMTTLEKLWVVSYGSGKTYFYDEGDARSYAGDRFSFDENHCCLPTDGIPFISKVTLNEAIVELNRLSNLDHEDVIGEG